MSLNHINNSLNAFLTFYFVYPIKFKLYFLHFLSFLNLRYVNQGAYLFYESILSYSYFH